MADRHLDGLVNIPTARDRYSRVWRARVSRVSGTSAWAVAAGLAPGSEFGPCDTRGLRLSVGDSVLLSFNAGDARDPVLVRRLQASEIPVLKHAEDVGDGAATSFAVTHGLGTRDVAVTVYDNSSPYGEISPSAVERDTVDQVTVTFGVAPAAGAYRVIVLG